MVVFRQRSREKLATCLRALLTTRSPALTLAGGMTLPRRKLDGTLEFGCHHEMARAKRRRVLKKPFSFRGGMEPLVRLVSGHRSDEQIFDAMGVARVC